jgi:hypothetical protein
VHDGEKLGAGFDIIFGLIDGFRETDDLAELPEIAAVGHGRRAHQGVAWPFKLNPVFGALVPNVVHGQPP